MEAQNSDPLAFGRVYEGMMAGRREGAPLTPRPQGAAALAEQLGLVPKPDDAAEAPAAVKGDDGG